MEKGFRGRSSMALFLVHERGSNMLVCINKRSRWVPLVIRGLDRCRGWSPVTAREMEGVDFSRFLWSALVESRWKDRCKKWKTAKKEEIMMEEVNREAGKEQRVGKQENKEKCIWKKIKQKRADNKIYQPSRHWSGHVVCSNSIQVRFNITAGLRFLPTITVYMSCQSGLLLSIKSNWIRQVKLCFHMCVWSHSTARVLLRTPFSVERQAEYSQRGANFRFQFRFQINPVAGQSDTKHPRSHWIFQD